jgi:hypothetical protein
MVNSRDEMKRWVDGWAETGRALEGIRREELRRMTPDAHRRAIASLLDLGCRFRTSRPTSGLVEMQDLLARIRP